MNHSNSFTYRESPASGFASLCRQAEPVADHVCCPYCLGENIRYLGQRIAGDLVILQYHCNPCNENFERTAAHAS